MKAKFIEDMVPDVPISSFKIRFEETPSPFLLMPVWWLESRDVNIAGFQ